MLLKGFIVGRKGPILIHHHAASSDFIVHHEGDIMIVFCFLIKQDLEF